MMIGNDFCGTFLLEFVGGSTREVSLTGYSCDADARPIVLFGEDGTVYNFSTVISFKKKEN